MKKIDKIFIMVSYPKLRNNRKKFMIMNKVNVQA